MAARIGLKKLADFSRQLATMLEAGLALRHSLSVLEKGARPPLKATYHRLGTAIESGSQLSQALEAEGRAFPPLFIRMVQVAEMAGGMDRVLKRLAEYYEFARSLWSRLLTRLIYPVFEYFALVGVLAVVTYILDLFDTDRIVPRPVPGFSAGMVLLLGLAIFLAPIIAYFVATRVFGGLRPVHEFLVRLPLLGNIVKTLALARFSWCMELMTEAGVNIFDALTWSLQATANAAFAARGPGIVGRIRDGLTLHQSLEMTGLFPNDYIELVRTGEVSGSMPDMFRRLAKAYLEKAETALRALTTILGWTIWVIVAVVIIFYIFRFFSMYLGAIGGLMAG